jgi:hypothetical protein
MAKPEADHFVDINKTIAMPKSAKKHLTFPQKYPYNIVLPAGAIDARSAEQCVRHFFCKFPANTADKEYR